MKILHHRVSATVSAGEIGRERKLKEHKAKLNFIMFLKHELSNIDKQLKTLRSTWCAYPA